MRPRDGRGKHASNRSRNRSRRAGVRRVAAQHRIHFEHGDRSDATTSRPAARGGRLHPRACRAGRGLRRPDRPERGRQPAADDDLRRLPRRRGALRDRLRVRRRRRRVRLLTPLPGVPSDVEQGRRLDAPAPRPRDEPRPAASAFDLGGARAAECAEVLLETRIDALDITVLAAAATRSVTGRRSTASGCRPTPRRSSTSTPTRSPDLPRRRLRRRRGRGARPAVGDGTPVHITIPTDNPWVPLRILALGKTDAERVEADVYLLTDRAAGPPPGPHRAEQRPDARPQRRGHRLAPRRPALGSGMEWVPDQRVADQGRDRRRRAAARVRPRDRRVGRRAPVAGRRRVREPSGRSPRRVARPVPAARRRRGHRRRCRWRLRRLGRPTGRPGACGRLRPAMDRSRAIVPRRCAPAGPRRPRAAAAPRLRADHDPHPLLALRSRARSPSRPAGGDVRARQRRPDRPRVDRRRRGGPRTPPDRDGAASTTRARPRSRSPP